MSRSRQELCCKSTDLKVVLLNPRRDEHGGCAKDHVAGRAAAKQNNTVGFTVDRCRTGTMEDCDTSRDLGVTRCAWLVERFLLAFSGAAGALGWSRLQIDQGLPVAVERHRTSWSWVMSHVP